MDRIINVKVSGNHISKDNKNAGVRGEANVTNLRITFDEGWRYYAKTVTFFDAQGNNPVKRVETTDLIEDNEPNTLTYLTPIPKEALAIAGELTFVIDGYFDGKRQRSIADKLVVKDAPISDNAAEPTDPTPEPYEQLQGQIDKILVDIQLTKDAKETSQVNAQEAIAAKDAAETYAQSASNAANKAEAALSHNPVVVDGCWHVWSTDVDRYINTGVIAQAGSTVYVGYNPPLEAAVWIKPSFETEKIESIRVFSQNDDEGEFGEEEFVSPQYAYIDDGRWLLTGFKLGGNIEDYLGKAIVIKYLPSSSNEELPADFCVGLGFYSQENGLHSVDEKMHTVSSDNKKVFTTELSFPIADESGIDEPIAVVYFRLGTPENYEGCDLMVYSIEKEKNAESYTDRLKAEIKLYVDERILGLANQVAQSPANITLYADRWEQNADETMWYQEVVVANANITPYSKVDLQLSAEQITIFYEKDLAFVTENDGGVVTVFCIGQKPENDYVIQATVSEVVVNGE